MANGTVNGRLRVTKVLQTATGAESETETTAEVTGSGIHGTADSGRVRST